jgi:hypothetical protein
MMYKDKCYIQYIIGRTGIVFIQVWQTAVQQLRSAQAVDQISIST